MRVLSRGFGSLALPCALLGVLYSDTLSARDVGFWSMPHRFAYCKSPRGRRFGSPAGQYSFLVLRQSVPSPGSSQQSPAPWLRLALLATPRCFPIQTKGMSTSLTHLFGVHHDRTTLTHHDRTTLTRNHTLSLFGHTPLSILPDG